MSTEDIVISEQCVDDSVACQSLENDGIKASNSRSTNSRKDDFKEPISISSPSDKKMAPVEKSSASALTSINYSSNDINDLSLSPILGLPPISSSKPSYMADTAFSISGQTPLHCLPGSSHSGKVTSPKIRSEYLSISAVPAAGTVDTNLVHSDLTNVEEWLKHKSDSMSSLEFDGEVKPSEIDVSDFLLKSVPSNSSLLDINSKLAHDVGLYTGGRPVTPSGLSNFSDNEGLSFTCTSDNIRSKFQSTLLKPEFSNLQADKGIFEEMLLMDRPTLKKNLKAKDSAIGLDEKGLFEELLLPGVQEWLLSVSSMDKKDSTSTTPVDSLSVPPSPNDCSTSVVTDHVDTCSSSKDTFDDYDLIGRSISSLRLLTSQEIENLPSRTLEYDESQLKNENDEEEIKQMKEISNGTANEIDNKLFNILAMETSNDTIEANSASSINLSVSDSCNALVESMNKPVVSVSPDQFMNNSDLGINLLPKIGDQKKIDIKSLETVVKNSVLKVDLRIPLETISKRPVFNGIPSGICDNPSSLSLSNNSTAKIKPIKILTKPQSINSIISANNLKMETVMTKSVAKDSATLTSILPLKHNFSKEIASNNDVEEPAALVIDRNLQSEQFMKENKNLPGIAKVNISVNYKSNTTNVSITSSNKEHTVFKINTSDMLHAISSIKEPFLEPLGLKSQQLMETARAASKLLGVHSSISKVKKNIQSSISPSQNFEINQLIQETKVPVTKAKRASLTANHSKFKGDNTIMTISPTKVMKYEKISTKHSTKPKRKLDEKQIIYMNKINRLTSNRTLGENVAISLLPGAPPTMVSVPSVLDALSGGPTTSKINLANVFANSEDAKQRKQKTKGNEETQQVSDEKTNSALLQLGFDPYSIVPDVDPDGIKKWHCPISSCSKLYPKLSYLKVHILTHKGIRPYKCSYESCDWSFYTSYKLKRHLETHLKRRDFVCTEPDCNRRFTTIYNLNTHLALHKRPKTWICSLPSCRLSFHTRRKLEVHMRNHTDVNPPYKCTKEGCHKAYFTPNSLASHTRGHHKEDEIRCQWIGCGKKFDKPCRLKAHMKAHTGQRPYACTFKGCNWRFHCASKLSRHQRKHTNDRKYSCPICKKAFLRSEHLKGHILTHTGVRNFQCPIQHCDAKFTAKSSLYVHLKKHKNAGPKFPCPFESCEEVHETKINLGQHLLNNHSPLLDANHLDYITMVSDKEVDAVVNAPSVADSILPLKSQFAISPCVPLALQSASIDTSCVVGIEICGDRVSPANSSSINESSLVPLLAMSSGVGLIESQPENCMPLLAHDGFLAFSELETSPATSEFGFPDLPLKKNLNQKQTKGITFHCESSARTDVLGNLFLSQRAKKRQQSNLSRKLAGPELSTINFSDELTLSSSVGDSLSAHFQPVLLHEDAMSNSIYQDLLTDPTNDSQSTINLRDLE